MGTWRPKAVSDDAKGSGDEHLPDGGFRRRAGMDLPPERTVAMPYQKNRVPRAMKEECRSAHQHAVDDADEHPRGDGDHHSGPADTPGDDRAEAADAPASNIAEVQP